MKYEFVEGDRAQGLDGRVLRRIRALVDIPLRNVRAGDMGGYIESESNLSHEGQAWVGGVARAYGEALVSDNALLHGQALAYESAMLRGSCIVGGQAQVCGQATVLGHARASGGVCIYGDAAVSGDALVGQQMILPSGALILSNGMAQYFGVTDKDGLDPVTLYNDRSGEVAVLSNTFTGGAQGYLASLNASGSPSPMHKIMVEMALKKIESARASFAKAQRRAA